MGIVAVKIKILPASLEIDLEELKELVKSEVEKADGKNCKFEEESIAFGLKAIIAFFAWREEKELSELEHDLENIEGVSSIQTIDIRRAFG